jgi:hypothetical protein
MIIKVFTRAYVFNVLVRRAKTHFCHVSQAEPVFDLKVHVIEVRKHLSTCTMCFILRIRI